MEKNQKIVQAKNRTAQVEIPGADKERPPTQIPFPKPGIQPFFFAS